MSIPKFLRRLLNDTRGEDVTEKSSGLSNAGKVAIAAMAISASAAGATVLANNQNGASDTTSQKINQTVGAQADKTDKVSSPFK